MILFAKSWQKRRLTTGVIHFDIEGVLAPTNESDDSIENLLASEDGMFVPLISGLEVSVLKAMKEELERVEGELDALNGVLITKDLEIERLKRLLPAKIF